MLNVMISKTSEINEKHYCKMNRKKQDVEVAK